MKIDYTGQRIGQCVVLGKIPRQPEHYQQVWRLLCDCGNECEKVQAQLKRPSPTTRCPACYARAAGDASRVHGETNTYLFRLWEAMNRRCYDRGVTNYKNWGGRGITVHPAWRKDYLTFAMWIRANIGERPSAKFSLDRRDNDGNYEPGNVRWATAKMQRANTRKWADDTPKRLQMKELAAQLAVGPRRPVGRPKRDRSRDPEI